MKRKLALSIALLVSLTILPLTSLAQNQIKVVADTGVITLGENQVLRLTAVSVDGELGGGIHGVRFKQMKYAQDICNNGVCKHTVASQNTSAPTLLTTGEAASFYIYPAFTGGVYVGVRGVVLSSRRNVRVNALIINSATGEVVALFDANNCGLALIDVRDCG